VIQTPSYADAVRYLTQRINFERAKEMPYRSRQLKLQRMCQLLDHLGNPQRQLAIVHIAGTKGKGSTACTLSALLRAAGYRTGLFVSPHIQQIEERFQVDDRLCSPEQLVWLIQQVQPAVEAMDRAGERPTFFEIVNAIAYLHFVASAVDWVVLEVGLGGRLDSTNVCDPRLCVITNISFDHIRQLGTTLAAIAGEKAGIIKPGVPVISGVLPPEPRDVIRAAASERQAPLLELDRDFFVHYRSMPLNGQIAQGGEIDFQWRDEFSFPARRGLRLSLVGRHQAMNTSLAIACLDQIHGQAPLPDATLYQGLSQVRCPARIEIVSTAPLVLLDTAHNVAAAEALAEVLGELPPVAARHLFLTATQGKNLRGMLSQLIPCFDDIIISRYVDNPRSYDPAQLFQLAIDVARQQYPDGGLDELDELDEASSCRVPRRGKRPLRIQWFSDPVEGWKTLQGRVQQDGLVCITGSFFFVGEARRLLEASGWTKPLVNVPVAFGDPL
jgi:dihydrofolate synthase/folylpolyglutamate synthase